MTVPHDGAWALRVALKDAAGNLDPGAYSTLEPLRLDTEPPCGEFLPMDPQDPSRIRLSASDATSGVDHVEIEVRRQGDNAWVPLSVDGAYSAVVDDSQLAAGAYDVRARVFDRALNEKSVTTTRAGTPLRLTLPARVKSVIAVGRPTRVRVKGKKYKRVLVGSPVVPFGKALSLEGKLSDPAGNPRARETVTVTERVGNGDWRNLGSVRTSATGAFVFKALAGPSRTIRFSYGGTATTLPETKDVVVQVPAATTIAPSKPRVRNGNDVTFRGRTRSGPLPAAGKILALQALTTKGWRTFATPRARAKDGRWSLRYRFTGTPTRTRYSFRVVTPVESGYPYAQGTSRTARVLVTP